MLTVLLSYIWQQFISKTTVDTLPSSEGDPRGGGTFRAKKSNRKTWDCLITTTYRLRKEPTYIYIYIYSFSFRRNLSIYSLEVDPVPLRKLDIGLRPEVRTTTSSCRSTTPFPTLAAWKLHLSRSPPKAEEFVLSTANSIVAFYRFLLERSRVVPSRSEKKWSHFHVAHVAHCGLLIMTL